jgi:hypothetical protein
MDWPFDGAFSCIGWIFIIGKLFFETMEGLSSKIYGGSELLYIKNL